MRGAAARSPAADAADAAGTAGGAVAERRVLLLGTRSEGKLRELGPMLREAGFEPRTLAELGIAPDPAEDAVEAYETSRRTPSRRRGTISTGCVRSARGLPRSCWPTIRDSRCARCTARPASGASDGAADRSRATRSNGANNAKLVEALRGVGDRRARYVCVAAITSAHGEWCGRGSCSGEIVEVPRGEDGFGYDPHFHSEELRKTFGEATRAEKAEVGHRARAVRAVLELVRRAERTTSDR